MRKLIAACWISIIYLALALNSANSASIDTQALGGWVIGKDKDQYICKVPACPVTSLAHVASFRPDKDDRKLIEQFGKSNAAVNKFAIKHYAKLPAGGGAYKITRAHKINIKKLAGYGFHIAGVRPKGGLYNPTYVIFVYHKNRIYTFLGISQNKRLAKYAAETLAFAWRP